MSQPISVAIEDGIAVITIDSPPVNAISAAIRSGLLAITRGLATNRDARAVVLVCAGRARARAVGADRHSHRIRGLLPVSYTHLTLPTSDLV